MPALATTFLNKKKTQKLFASLKQQWIKGAEGIFHFSSKKFCWISGIFFE